MVRSYHIHDEGLFPGDLFLLKDIQLYAFLCFLFEQKHHPVHLRVSHVV